MPTYPEKSVHPSLVRERSNQTFTVDKLTNVLDGSEKDTNRRRELENLVFEDPVLKSAPISYLSREEKYSLAVKKSARCVHVFRVHGITDPFDRTIVLNAAFPYVANPFSLHTAMFLTTMVTQGTDDVIEKWLDAAMDFRILGTYAQTELGHGTFIRGLETTATYDESAQQFILNSPTLTSLKWWPGALGMTVNFAVVVAQLYTKGECYGPHTFLVQLRSLEDHQPLPGITIGDIGPKFGYDNVDNGFLQFTNHRIDYKQLLMKHNKMLPDGTYEQATNPKLTYGTMVMIRGMIMHEFSRYLSAAVTIATRYSAVRRQGRMDDHEDEISILNYRTQQYKIFPLIATSVAHNLVGQYMKSVVMGFLDQNQRTGDVQLLPELHALSAGMKAITSSACAAGIEVCRLACGGHGYSEASGLPKLYREIVAACTYEGENTVMLLQTARYLIKSLNDDMNAPVVKNSSISYLREPLTKRGYVDSDVRDNDVIQAYRHRAHRLVTMAARDLTDKMASGSSRGEAWNRCSVQLVHAAIAHCDYLIVQMFHDALHRRPDIDASVRHVLNSLFSLYACHGLVEKAGDFLEDGFLTESDMHNVRRKLDSLLDVIRPQAINIVDSFDIRDEMLQSALGRYDGDVYRHLVEFAKNSPLNKSNVHSSYDLYLKPMLKSNL